MRIIIFENDNIENLYPITLTRPGFDIMCGGTTLYKALKVEFPQANFEFKIRDYIQAYADNKFGAAQKNLEKSLFIDSSVVPDIKIIKELVELANVNDSFIVTSNGKRVAGYSDTAKSIDEVEGRSVDINFKIFKKLADVIINNKEILGDNLEYLKKGLTEIKPGVFVGKNVLIEGCVTFDSSAGPIIINEGSRVNSFAVLRGPIFIGKNSQINSFSEIKSSSCFGEVCKVGGEITNSILQEYSNKQHVGFLGDSYIGAWVNIGGGTSNSNMKNTLGTVKMTGIDTGQQFLGCVIGDYTKTSIGTLIYTGKVIGVSSFLYDDVKNDVPSFTNLLEDDKLIECPIDIAHRVQKATRDRRDVKTTYLDKELLEDVYNLTKGYRKKFKVKKGKLS